MGKGLYSNEEKVEVVLLARICVKCHQSFPMMVKRNGEYICKTCYTEESPMIDETWRIIKFVLDNNLVWVDFDAGSRRPQKRRH